MFTHKFREIELLSGIFRSIYAARAARNRFAALFEERIIDDN